MHKIILFTLHTYVLICIYIKKIETSKKLKDLGVNVYKLSTFTCYWGDIQCQDQGYITI
jgi:hypothetical protein